LVYQEKLQMMVHIPQVLSPEQVAECRQLLQQAQWVDGKATAGFQSAMTKDNLQLPQDCPQAKAMGELILAALSRNPLFISAALPNKVFPPLFNCYQGGQSFGLHVDNAVREVRGTGERIRTDLSATLFFTNPEEYDGGELLVEDTYGAHSVKLPAGDLILYPSTSLHRVNPVTRGARVCSFFWLQSMVRDDGQRTLLFDLDSSIQQLNRELGAGHASSVQLTGVYHNLLRRWTDI
jgi:PKHD-type hydroxylase